MLGTNTVLPLWRDAIVERAFTLDDPYAAPETAIVSAVASPCLLGYLSDKPNGRAMLVLPGGGYTALMVGREGVAVARWLTTLGYHAYVLIHRFPNRDHGVSAPLDDAMEAIRMVRACEHAPRGLGVVGLSSGGHLAACLAAEYPAEWSPPASRFAGEATHPDCLVIGYAPISTNAIGRTIVPEKPPLLPLEKQAMYDRLQPDAQLLAGPPPAFIVYANNDPVVPVENARRLHSALTEAGGEAELHIFADAPHGFGLDTPGMPVSLWPSLCEAWLRQTGFS